jgi:hypothetical protein
VLKTLDPCRRVCRIADERELEGAIFRSSVGTECDTEECCAEYLNEKSKRTFPVRHSGPHSWIHQMIAARPRCRKRRANQSGRRSGSADVAPDCKRAVRVKSVALYNGRQRLDFRYTLLATKLARHCNMSRWGQQRTLLRFVFCSGKDSLRRCGTIIRTSIFLGSARYPRACGLSASSRC